jgi:hypothetical protein
MGVTSDVGIAVTSKVDKLLRETLNAIAHGHEAIEMLDAMFVREEAGWKLYHNDCIKWYTDVDVVVKAVHDFLTAAIDGDLETPGVDYSDCITYIVLTPEYVSVDDGAVQNCGNQNDPFNLGYTFSLDYTSEKGEST